MSSYEEQTPSQTNRSSQDQIIREMEEIAERARNALHTQNPKEVQDTFNVAQRLIDREYERDSQPSQATT